MRASLLCFILFLIVSFYFSRKFFGQDISYLYTLLLSSSPLMMTSARRVLQDSCLNLFWALSIWLFLDFLIGKKKSTFIIFILTYSLSIVIKESSIVLLVFFIFSFFLFRYQYREKMSTDYLIGLISLPFLITGISYIILLKGLSNVFLLARFILGVHFPTIVTSVYSLFAMGPWYKYIIDYLLLMPIITLLAIGYFFYIIFSRKIESKIMYFAGYLIIVYTIFSNARYSKIIRFVLSLDIAIVLFATLALCEIFRQDNKNRQLYYVFLAAAIIYCINYFNFLYLFYQVNIYDPISYHLLMSKKIIPQL